MKKVKLFYNSLLFIVISLLIACTNEKSEALQASMDTTEVMLTTSAAGGIRSVLPYGRTKLITIFKPRIIKGNKIIFSYILESESNEEMVMVTSYTEGNIAALTSNFYYSGSGYDMSKKTISFFPMISDWVSGRTKVTLYFVTMQELESRENKTQAASNVITFYIKFSNGIPMEIDL